MTTTMSTSESPVLHSPPSPTAKRPKGILKKLLPPITPLSTTHHYFPTSSYFSQNTSPSLPSHPPASRTKTSLSKILSKTPDIDVLPLAVDQSVVSHRVPLIAMTTTITCVSNGTKPTSI
ncbi:hypothetical protein EYC84_005231 [Monilinia fructicola]|uniref:Uncharacterized protein n=1 Tax=Monilinia fructicola TaxID=38448 RepID=A0A5M9JVU9_MONFR|nr:hypothetical protein EYC84_005231 [Monilinia fructicola]